MRTLAIPALIYVEVPRDEDEAALQAAEELRSAIDIEDGYNVALPGYPHAEVRISRDDEIKFVEGYNTPYGSAVYHVVLRMSIEGCDQGEAPEDWPDDDAQPGDYDFRVEARNLYEAVEAAKDKFACNYAVEVLDNVNIEAVSVQLVSTAVTAG